MNLDLRNTQCKEISKLFSILAYSRFMKKRHDGLETKDTSRTRTLDRVKIIASEIFSVLAYHNLNLKRIYDTTKEYSDDCPEEDA